MPFHPPSIDGAHAMYQPDKRAPARIGPAAIPKREGTQAEQEAWMRAKQAKGTVPHRSPRVEHAIGAVCSQFDVTRAQLLGKSRANTIVAARGQACRELRELELSYPQIGLALGLDHSTVQYHCRKVELPRAAVAGMTFCEGGIDV